jgi:fatty acid-binding protein DegV
VIGICTDSSAQLPPDLVAHLGVEVVPSTVCIDDIEHLDGVDLDADEFYARFTCGSRPTVKMCEPSPGQFAAAYEDLIARGCTEILSVHVVPTVSGTLNAARLAAHATPVPVRVIDSASVGFGVGCCVWAAADAVQHGATLDQAAVAAEQAAAGLGHLLLMHGQDQGQPAIDVLQVASGTVTPLSKFRHGVDAINDVSARAVAWGQRLRIGVGHSSPESLAIADALASAVGEAANVIEVVRFRIGPSMGTLTGPGAVGCVVSPAG